MFKHLARVVFLIILPVLTVAQQADSLKELSRRIDILTQEIERLTLGSVDETVGPTRTGLGPAASKVYSTKRSGVSFAGYGELVYRNFAAKRDDGAASTSTDRIDYYRNILYVGYRFNDWILFNSEIEVEHGSTEEGGAVSMELGYIDLMLSPALNIRAGMLLVPVGIVNEMHEPPTFFATDRPSVERTIIPSTWRATGAGVYGQIVHGVEYRAYLVESLRMENFSSAGIRGGRQAGSEALAEDFALTGRVEYTAIPGVTLGLSAFAGKTGQGAADSTGSAIDARTIVLSGHGLFAWKGLELRGLFARTSVDEADRVAGYMRWKSGSPTTPSFGSVGTGWYVSAGYDVLQHLVPGAEQTLSPFVQYEALNSQSQVPAGLTANPVYDQSALVLGLSWKPYPGVAFKIDYRDNSNGAGTATDQINAAVTYMY